MDPQGPMQHSDPAPRILIIDDDPDITEVLATIAEGAGCIVKTLFDGGLVQGFLSSFDPDVIFLDLFMPNVNGIDVLHALGEGHCRAKLLLMSGLEKRTLLSSKKVAINNGLEVIGIIEKPFNAAEIEGILKPFVDRMNVKIPRPSPRMAPPEHFGPILYFEKVTNLSGFDAESKLRFRLSDKWRMDSGSLHTMKAMIGKELGEDARLGLLELKFRMLKLELLRQSADLLDGLEILIPIESELLLTEQFPSSLLLGVNVAGLDAEAVYLEICDFEEARNNEVFLENLTKLDVMGFKISCCVRGKLDDVLICIKELPLDDVVVDMAAPDFTERSLNDGETQFDYGSLVSFAAKENVTISAKNIRSSTHLDFASRCGFARVSGEILDKPQTELTA